MFRGMREDIRAALERDPAAINAFEIYMCYPGIHALQWHRVANWLYRYNRKLLARIVASWSQRRTGIDIHPAAKIGRRVFIDHGTGVVIGETAEVGDDVLIYQGVTLGGTGKHIGKRHPTIGKNVMISAGAKVLGPITIGDNSKIGAQSVVLKDVPPGCTVVGVPGRIVKFPCESLDLQPATNDPVLEEITRLNCRIDYLERELKLLKAQENKEEKQ